MSVETYEGFQFRYCWDIDRQDTIRIYVEKRPQQTRHLRAEDIYLNPAKDGAPEYIKIPDEIHLSIFTEAQSVAYEWANRVIKVAMSNSIRTRSHSMSRWRLMKEKDLCFWAWSIPILVDASIHQGRTDQLLGAT